MKICIVGAGAIGGYLGAKLALAGEEVTLIARGPHLAAIQRDGLKLQMGDGPAEVVPGIKAMSDMAKAGDGKNLLVIEEWKEKTKASGVLFFSTDADTFSPTRTATVRNGRALDVAAHSSGSVVVSALPTAAPALDP